MTVTERCLNGNYEYTRTFVMKHKDVTEVGRAPKDNTWAGGEYCGKNILISEWD